MYVIPLFEGDVDMEVARKQHDVYPQALEIIVWQCNRYTEFARSLLNDGPAGAFEQDVAVLGTIGARNRLLP